MDRNREKTLHTKRTETDKNRKKLTETDRNAPKWTETERYGRGGP